METFLFQLRKLPEKSLVLTVRTLLSEAASEMPCSTGPATVILKKKPVKKGVNDLIDAGEIFDTVILDPPRQGAFDIVSMLPGLGAGQVIYISCNPATLARDLAILCTKGYKLSYLAPVDMFPHTHHMESVALLKRTPQ